MGNKKKNNHRAAYWRECDVNHLAGHFHRFNKEDTMRASQFERLGELHLTGKELKKLFSQPSHIDSFDIRLGLDKKVSTKNEFTFRPVISVIKKGKKKEMEFHHGPFPNPKLARTNSITKQSAEVPVHFKSWLIKNWMELDASLIDDVFTASFNDTDMNANTQAGLPVKRDNRRLISYHFNEGNNVAFLNFIRNMPKYGPEARLDYFTFHLGVDMNKLAHKEMFTFSPVFEVRLTGVKPEKISELRASGLRCVPEILIPEPAEAKKGEQVVYTGNETVYYEYIAPCPPTCSNT